MELVDFAAEADIVGKRVLISWRIVDVAAGEIDAEPDLTLYGKARDFDYRNVADAQAVVVYRAGEFPPDDPDVRIDELRRPPVRDDAGQVLLVDVVSVSRRVEVGRDEFAEYLRRTRTSVLGADGTVVERRDEILEYGGGGGCPPNVTRYYELRGPLVAGPGRPPRAVATPTAPHRSARYLYDLVPGVWRRHDTPAIGGGTPELAGVETGEGAFAGDRPFVAIPEARQDAGQLRRFFDLFGLVGDHLRSRVEGLGTLHDIDNVDYRFLGYLAQWVGWDLSQGAEVAQQRHEIRYAAELYRLTGTVPGVRVWAKRLSGWDVDVREYAENVLFTNDPGGEMSPTRSGSFTVDTTDAELVGALDTGETADRGDYTYDSGTGPADRYSMHTVGVVAPLDLGTSGDVDIRRDRLLAAADRYVPANLRVVVVIPDPAPLVSEGTHVLGVNDSGDSDL